MLLFSTVTHTYQDLLARYVLVHAMRMFQLCRRYQPSAMCSLLFIVNGQGRGQGDLWESMFLSPDKQFFSLPGYRTTDLWMTRWVAYPFHHEGFSTPTSILGKVNYFFGTKWLLKTFFYSFLCCKQHYENITLLSKSVLSNHIDKSAISNISSCWLVDCKYLVYTFLCSIQNHF